MKGWQGQQGGWGAAYPGKEAALEALRHAHEPQGRQEVLEVYGRSCCHFEFLACRQSPQKELFSWCECSARMKGIASVRGNTTH